MEKNMLGLKVIVRTYSAGVFYGTLEAREGKEVLLANAKRIWSWEGANTLSEISLHGVAKGSKISESVPKILLTEATEIITCQPASIASLDSASWE